jgi:hypothetical protein
VMANESRRAFFHSGRAPGICLNWICVRDMLPGFCVCVVSVDTTRRCSGGRLGAFGGLIMSVCVAFYTHTTLEPTEGKHLWLIEINLKKFHMKVQFFIIVPVRHEAVTLSHKSLVSINKIQFILAIILRLIRSKKL